MEIILIWIAGLMIVGLSTTSYVHRSRQRAILTKRLKVDKNLRNDVEPLPDYYAAMEAQLEVIEAEERKLS